MSKVLVLLSPGFEEIEAVTIIDILRRAGIDVIVAGLEKDMVTGSHNISIKSDQYYKEININEYEYIVLPGGQPGTDNLRSNPKVIEWSQKFSKDDKNIAAICSAPTVLAKAGIIKKIKVTSYPTEKNKFNSEYYSEDVVVRDKNVITSRGVGTAIDFSLELVNIIKGKKIRDDLASKILWK